MNLSALLSTDPNLLLTQFLISGVRVIFLLVAAFQLRRMIRTLTDKLNRTLRGFTDSVERQQCARTLSYIVRAVVTTVLFILFSLSRYPYLAPLPDIL